MEDCVDSGCSGGLPGGKTEDQFEHDPARAKRRLANRASAARAKVRKERRKADIDKDFSVLQQQMVGLSAEKKMLQESIARIEYDNKRLLFQLKNLEDQMLRRDQETRALESHLRLYKNSPSVMQPSPCIQQGLALSCTPQDAQADQIMLLSLLRGLDLGASSAYPKFGYHKPRPGL